LCMVCLDELPVSVIHRKSKDQPRTTSAGKMVAKGNKPTLVLGYVSLTGPERRLVEGDDPGSMMDPGPSGKVLLR